VALRQFTPPTAVIRNYNPLLPVEPTLVGTQITAVLPNLTIGDPNGVSGPPSNGPGKNGGIGPGDGGGVGPRKGPGSGDDDCCGVVDGGPRAVGRTVEPVLLVKIDPEYSDEARRAKVQGIVVLHIDVDTHGQPRNIRLVRGLGLGLDQRAMDAVRQWKFRAGTVNGKPAVTSAVVEVTFRLL